MTSSTLNILGYQVFTDDINKINPSEKLVINTLNGHSYSVAKKDLLFQEALNSSDILLPDGVSVTISAKIETGKKIRKIAGFDIFKHLLIQLNSQKKSCFFLGSIPQTLDQIKEKLIKEYPNIKVESYSPPFVEEFSKEQSKKMCQIINDFKPDVLFVGMTAPKQEKWVYLYKSCIKANIICSIGAVFDFYAETKKRPSNWMIKNNLEWFGRFIKEPKRLFYRYVISTPTIFIDLFLHKLHLNNTHQPEKNIKQTVSKELGKISDMDVKLHYKILDKQPTRKYSKETLTNNRKN